MKKLFIVLLMCLCFYSCSTARKSGETTLKVAEETAELTKMKMTVVAEITQGKQEKITQESKIKQVYPDNKWLILGIILMSIAIYWIYRRFFR